MNLFSKMLIAVLIAAIVVGFHPAPARASNMDIPSRQGSHDILTCAAAAIAALTGQTMMLQGSYLYAVAGGDAQKIEAARKMIIDATELTIAASIAYQLLGCNK